MNLVEGARIFLAQQQPVRDVLGHDADWDVWLFQETLYPVVEGSQSVGAVLTTGGNWAAPNNHNTARFPRLVVEVYADSVRDATGNFVENDTAAKIEEAFVAFNSLLHRPSQEVLQFGDLRVLGSISEGEPLLFPVIDGQGMRRARFSYSITLG